MKVSLDWGLVHTYQDILNPQLFLCGFAFRPHVSVKFSVRIRNNLKWKFLKYAKNPK